MELRAYIDILRRRWMTILIVTLLALAAAAALTFTSTVRYTAKTQLFFAVESSGTATDMAQGSTFAEKQMTSYAQVATSPLVLNPVIHDLGLRMTASELAGMTTATVPAETVILQISVVDTNPQRAAKIANAIGRQVSRATDDLTPANSDGSQAVRATTLTPALPPTAPSSPNVPRNLAAGVIVGLLLGGGFAVARHVLDTKVRTEEDIRGVTDRPVLGTIAFDEAVPRHPVVVADEPLSAPSEAIRRLRTNLQFVQIAEGANSLVVTSSIPGEGKTTTALNLAVALADNGARVILVDADLRRPSIALRTGLEESVGLTTVLIGRATVSEVAQSWRGSRLDVLTAGQVPPNPSELLGSQAMSHLLDQLEATYDVVVLDSPPLLPVTDAAILSHRASGTLLVVGADRVHRPQLVESIESIVNAGGKLHGLVMNKIARREAKPYMYAAGYAPRSTDDEALGPPDWSAEPIENEKTATVTAGRRGV